MELRSDAVFNTCEQVLSHHASLMLFLALNRLSHGEVDTHLLGKHSGELLLEHQVWKLIFSSLRNDALITSPASGK